MQRKVKAAVQVIRNGGYFGSLRGFPDNPPTIKMEESADIKTVLEGSFQAYVYDSRGQRTEFDPLNDQLKPVLIINGKASPLGIFLPVSITPSYSENSKEETIDIEAYDRGWLPQTMTGQNRVYFKKGTKYVDAIQQLLAASGIVLVAITDIDAVLTEDREDWELGTSYLEIANDLLTEINYKQLWFDASGMAVVEPIRTPTVKNVRHRLDSRDPSTLVHPGLSRKTDIYKTPNVFICVCNSPDKNVSLTAIARNTNIYSPLSIQRRQREIVQLESVNNIASQEALQRYADRKLFESLMTGETISVTSSLLPGWGVGDVVSLHYHDVHALCVSRGWSMTLKAGGTMSHTLEKIVYNMDDAGEMA